MRCECIIREEKKIKLKDKKCKHSMNALTDQKRALSVAAITAGNASRCVAISL